MIVGGPGSGKSTLAQWLGAQTGLPVQHMDHIHWQSGWVERTTEAKVIMIQEVEAQDRWIIEGGLSSRYGARLDRADMLVWPDLPDALRLWWVSVLSWRHRGQVRPDLLEGCPEQLGSQIISFLKWVWDHRNKARIKVVEALEAHQNAQVVHHLKSKRDVKLFHDRFVQRDLPDKL